MRARERNVRCWCRCGGIGGVCATPRDEEEGAARRRTGSGINISSAGVTFPDSTAPGSDSAENLDGDLKIKSLSGRD